MERSYGTYIPPQQIGGGMVGGTQTGVEAKAPPTPRYLQNQRSYNVLQTNEPSRVVSTAAAAATTSYNGDRQGSAGLGEVEKARKGSLRHAVRRIFGRRSKEVDAPQTQITPPRPGNDQSIPIPLSAREELSPVRTRDDGVQRTRSTPITNIPASDIQRTRSPYAMQFPHSARLKPLELGNPFATPGSQLRRRKTLPTIQNADPSADTLPTPHESPEQRRAHATSGDSFVTSASRQNKRRSRSADDLRSSLRQQAVSSRKRSEEIRQWRESFQGSVLRASGFTTKSSGGPDIYIDDDDRTPIPTGFDPSGGERLQFTPALQREASASKLASGSAIDAELSRDLEDRVARLEAGLQTFRGDLQQLSADRNRKTVLIGGVPARQRASSGGRTASILAKDLQQDLGPSDYRYHFRENVRPSMSSPLPWTPKRTDPSAVAPQFPVDEPAADDPFISPSGVAPVKVGATTKPSSGTTPQYTFRSLYQMLADERSARRRLETQLKSLQEQITNLHYQVSTQSNFQSQRGSYYAPMDPMAGSSRLHALLRDTETTPPSATKSQGQERFSGDQSGLMSRFSGSESEAGGGVEAEEFAQTPYEVYQTPHEEQGRFPFSAARYESDMF